MINLQLPFFQTCTLDGLTATANAEFAQSRQPSGTLGPGRMNKVLVYKSELLPRSETFIKEQVMACSRWRPVLVGTHRVEGLDLAGVSLRLLDRPDWPRVRALVRKLWRETGWPWMAALSTLRAEAAQLVHVHFGTEAVAMWPTLRRLGLPLLVTLHGADINTRAEWWRRPAAGPASRRYPDRLLALGRSRQVQFIAVSEAIRAQAIAFGLPADKITVCYIGVDHRRFDVSGLPVGQRPMRILFVGRLVEKKGGALLIDAFAELHQRHPEAELVMVGDGPLREPLQRQAAQRGVAVRFLGSQPSEAVRREIGQARVLCLPSVTADNGDAEGLGIVLIEAQACGVPVVTSARGGSTEAVVDGVTGFAFPERDVPALVRALERILTDPDLANRMSSAARAFAMQRFDLVTCTQALEREYDRIHACWIPGFAADNGSR